MMSWSHDGWIVEDAVSYTHLRAHETVLDLVCRLLLEKKYRVRKSNYETFWLGGIWSKWTSSDGAELESCCVLTTEPNDLIKPLHHRMPVIVPNGYEEQWTEQVKDADELKGLFAIMMSWSPDGWLVEDVKKKETDQMSLF